ncbi:UNVERIFIED_CONTAM: hypothetical protein HDU68_005308 [Siphonaria sp. JEL0065]|nr:hypothetical protein HDU68_005308 [Siphonaria sp. JEL0065]
MPADRDIDWRTFKNRTSITIALVGPYSRMANVTLDKSQVVGGLDKLNIVNFLDPGSFDFSWFWNQLGAEVGIAMINNDPSLLPFTTVNVKRFNNYCRVSQSGCAAATALEIATNHPDVVAIFHNGMDNNVAIAAASVYGQFKIPTCGCAETAPALLDKRKYPYFIQTMPMTPMAGIFPLMLRSWNVKRVAFIAPRSILSTNMCGAIITLLQDMGIEVASIILYSKGGAIDPVAQSLIQSQVRYIVICANPNPTADVYFQLAKRKIAVGPEYVWMAVNTPSPNGNKTLKYGPDYLKQAQGMMIFNPEFGLTDYQINLTNQFKTQLVSSFGVSDSTLEDILYSSNALGGYDCPGVLAAGISKLLHSNPETVLKSGSLRDNMNWTLFKSSEFRGLTGDPVVLSSGGDLSLVMDGQYLDTEMNPHSEL